MLPNLNFVSLRNLISLATADGHLYTWGKGFSKMSDSYIPQRLSSSLCFLKAALGWNHALLLTGNCVFPLFHPILLFLSTSLFFLLFLVMRWYMTCSLQS